MLKFFSPVSAADAVSQRQQQHAASAAVIVARTSAAAAMRRGPGRPKKLLSINNALAAESEVAEEEQPAKRSKYHNWSVHVRRMHALCAVADRMSCVFVLLQVCLSIHP